MVENYRSLLQKSPIKGLIVPLQLAIKREGYMVNAKGERCITGYNKLPKKANTARVEKCKSIALGELHSHVCISAICQRGVSIKWEGEDVRMYHHCYDPE